MTNARNDNNLIITLNVAGVAVAYGMLGISLWLSTEVPLATKGFWGMGIMLLTLSLINVVKYRFDIRSSEDRIRRYAEDKNLDMPLLYDEENRVADYFGTQGTPYFYVIDKQGVLRYEGICDNNQVPKRVDLKPETVTSHYVRDAIEAVLAGKPVKTKSVPTGST